MLRYYAMGADTCSLHQSWAKSYWSGCGSVCKAATGDKMEKEYLNFPPAPSFPLAPDYSPPLECPLPPPLHQDTQDTDVPIDHCTEDIYCWVSWYTKDISLEILTSGHMTPKILTWCNLAKKKTLWWPSSSWDSEDICFILNTILLMADDWCYPI